MKVKKQVLLDLDLPYDAIEDKIVDNTRWSIIHEIIFKMEDKYYKTSYSVGATEYQYESPWEYDDDIEIKEVVKKQITVDAWVEVENELE